MMDDMFHFNPRVLELKLFSFCLVQFLFQTPEGRRVLNEEGRKEFMEDYKMTNKYGDLKLSCGSRCG